MATRVSISPECISTFKALSRSNRSNKSKYIIYKITEDQSTVVVKESSPEPDYEVFRQRLTAVTEPRYAAYDVEFDLGEDGKRCRMVFISWVPGGASVKVFLSLCVKWVGANKVHVQLCMIYASTKEQLKNALDIKLSIHADSLDEIEWKSALNVASSGKV